jgi:hypothetical protein
LRYVATDTFSADANSSLANDQMRNDLSPYSVRRNLDILPDEAGA